MRSACFNRPLHLYLGGSVAFSVERVPSSGEAVAEIQALGATIVFL
jgi:hypothetical protein